jgi:transposase
LPGKRARPVPRGRRRSNAPPLPDYWAADALAELGAGVHLAHPLGVKGFSYRRVKNDERDAEDLADLLRMGRLPEAWIAPPATRECRELVRHRAKLVATRTHVKCQVHAVLAGAGVHVPMADLFGPAGRELLARVSLPAAMRERVESCLRLINTLETQITTASELVTSRLRGDPGYAAVQTIPGIGPTLGAIFVAEIGDVSRFARPEQLTCWAGLTPKHRESDTTVHRGPITKQSSKLVRWAAIEAVQKAPARTRPGALRERVAARRGRNIGKVAAARELTECVFYALRDGHVRRLADKPAPQEPPSPVAA